MAVAIGEMFSCSKIGAKSFEDGSQDISKDTEINLNNFRIPGHNWVTFISFSRSPAVITLIIKVYKKNILNGSRTNAPAVPQWKKKEY